MFKLVDFYIGRQVVLASLFVLLGLTSLLSLFSLINEIQIDSGTYQTSDALLYVGLMFPAELLELFPMSVLIGGLFALGNMASHSELTILRAAGMTSWQISGSAIKASLLLMLLVVAISEWVAPVTTKSAQQLKTIAISGGKLGASETGGWAKRENEIIQIGSILNDGQMRNIKLYQMSSNARLVAIIEAKRAVKEKEQWTLKEVTETHFYSDNVEIILQTSRVWLNPLQQSQVESLTLEPDSLNMEGIINYLNYLRANQLPTQNYELAFWRKLLQPLMIAIMVFLASSFVFGPMRNVSMGARMLSGIMLGFIFHIANQSFGPVSLIFGLWPLLGALLPVSLFATIGYWLMRKNS